MIQSSSAVFLDPVIESACGIEENRLPAFTFVYVIYPIRSPGSLSEKGITFCGINSMPISLQAFRISSASSVLPKLLCTTQRIFILKVPVKDGYCLYQKLKSIPGCQLDACPR